MSRLPGLALRNVARNRRRSRITLAAILVGVTAITVLNGVRRGFVDLLVRDVVRGRVGALQIHRAGYMENLEGMPLDLNMPNDPAFMARIEKIPGVSAVTPRINFAGLVTNGISQTMFVGRGLDMGREAKVCPNTGFDLDEGGQLLAPGDVGVALLGTELAHSFNAAPKGTPPKGDGPSFNVVTLSASSPEGRANSLSVDVKGLTRSVFAFENKRVVTVPLPLAQELLGMQGKVTEYAVSVESLDEIDAVAERLKAELGPKFEVSPWWEVQPFFRDVISVQQFLLGIISFVLFVIVLTGIANTMLMSVYERVREIGTLLAVGLRRRQILLLFLLESLVLGLLGGTLGALVGRAVVGVMAAVGLPFKMPASSTVSMLRPEVSVAFMAAAVVVATVGALVSAAYPAWKASRMNPVDALRSN